MKLILFLALTLGLSFSALAQQSATTPSAVMPAAAVMPDSEITEILLTINDSEVEAAQLAKKKARNAQVKDFAKMMVDDHKTNMKETKKIAKRSEVGKKKSELSKTIKDEAKAKYKELKASDKAAFDKTYLVHQVAMHEQALMTMNNTLIPNAKDAQLKAHLEKTRDAVQAHLNQVKDLNSKIQ